MRSYFVYIFFLGFILMFVGIVMYSIGHLALRNDCPQTYTSIDSTSYNITCPKAKEDTNGYFLYYLGFEIGLVGLALVLIPFGFIILKNFVQSKLHPTGKDGKGSYTKEEQMTMKIRQKVFHVYYYRFQKIKHDRPKIRNVFLDYLTTESLQQSSDPEICFICRTNLILSNRSDIRIICLDCLQLVLKKFPLN